MSKSAPPIPEGRHDWNLEVPEPVPPGIYNATVTAIELRESDGRDWLAWTFQLDDERTVGGGTSYSLGVRTKAYAWISALLGRDRLGGGTQVVESDLLGAPCRIVVELDAEDLAKVATVLPPELLSLPDVQAIVDQAQA